MLNWWPERYTGLDGTIESTGLVQGGLNGVPNDAVDGDWNNFMPRIGIAWRISDKWAQATPIKKTPVRAISSDGLPLNTSAPFSSGALPSASSTART